MKADKADDLRRGDVAAVEAPGDKDRNRLTVGRVLEISDSHITLQIYDGEPPEVHDRRALTWEGRVDNLNFEKGDPLPPADSARVKKLRKDLEALGSKDDQIIRCTARYRLEKEIFDIEHPIDCNDWSAWEEGGDESADGAKTRVVFGVVA